MGLLDMLPKQDDPDDDYGTDYGISPQSEAAGPEQDCAPDPARDPAVPEASSVLMRDPETAIAPETVFPDPESEEFSGSGDAAQDVQSPAAPPVSGNLSPAPSNEYPTARALIAAIAAFPAAQVPPLADQVPLHRIAARLNEEQDRLIHATRALLGEHVEASPEERAFLEGIAGSETIPERLERVITETGLDPADPESAPILGAMRTSMWRDPRILGVREDLVTRARVLQDVLGPDMRQAMIGDMPIESRVLPDSPEEFAETQFGLGASWRDAIITCGDRSPEAEPSLRRPREDDPERHGFPRRPKLWPVMMAWPPQREMRMILDAGLTPERLALFGTGLLEMQKRMLERAEKIDIYIRANNDRHDFAKRRMIGSRRPLELAMADPFHGIRWALLLDESQTGRSMSRIANMTQSRMRMIDGGELVASLDAVRIRRFSPSAVEVAIEEAAARGWGSVKISADLQVAKIAIQKARELGLEAEVTIRGGAFGLFTKTVRVMPPPPASGNPAGLGAIMKGLAEQQDRAIREVEEADRQAIAAGHPVMSEPSSGKTPDQAPGLASRTGERRVPVGRRPDEVPDLGGAPGFA